jgi:hypothetical protein
MGLLRAFEDIAQDGTFVVYNMSVRAPTIFLKLPEVEKVFHLGNLPHVLQLQCLYKT